MNRTTLLQVAFVALAAASTGCAHPAPVAAPDTAPPERRVAAQSQALVESASGVYDVRFVPEGDAKSFDLTTGVHRLTVIDQKSELKIELEHGAQVLTGVADEIDGRRWIAGLAGSDEGEPLVMHVTAVHADNQLVGSVVVDTHGHSYVASFVGTRFEQNAPARAEEPDDEKNRATHYHLPDGLH